MAAKIYKEGDRGEAVRQIQQALTRAGFPVGDDGVWGPKTTEAVRAFQKSRGLAADGIAGPKTMAALEGGGDGLKVVKAPISVHVTKWQNRKVKYIAVHYTAGSSSAAGMAMATRNVFVNRRASADFVVDDREAVQVSPDISNYYCWAVGDTRNVVSGGGSLYGLATNRNTVSIEICSCRRKGTSAVTPNHEGWYFTDKALDNAVRLVRRLMKEYGVPKERVIRHYDVTGKPCPGIVGWNDAILYDTEGKATSTRNNSREWLAFKERI